MTKIDLATVALPTTAYLAIQGVGKVQVTLTERGHFQGSEFINFESPGVQEYYFATHTKQGWAYGTTARSVTAYAA